LLPDATIICGSISDPTIQAELAAQRFDCAISNPPYGDKGVRNGKGPRYTGNKCEYAVIDIASDLADFGVFLIPQRSVPFRITGTASMEALEMGPDEPYSRFKRETGISLDPNMGICTEFAEKLWRGTNIRTEITTCDFVAVREA